MFPRARHATSYDVHLRLYSGMFDPLLQFVHAKFCSEHASNHACLYCGLQSTLFFSIHDVVVILKFACWLVREECTKFMDYLIVGNCGK